MSDFQSRLQQVLDADFLLERELGGAGMSRVFVATERALDRRVVVKVLPPELAAGVNVERFRREIQLAAQLQHPHIVPLLSAGDDHGILWFTMPYIEGESLRGTLARQKRLSSRDVVRILHDVVDALAYAHVRGVVHRDIKPDNILTSGMHALVTDFGVAKALSAAIPLHGGTTTGMAIGTPAYMAPEQLAADPAADHRVDLYAVGLLAYELLTGRGPFAGSSPQATLAAQLTQMPDPPHRTYSDIPEALSALIMRCLEKDASKRPASASALLAELEALPPMSGTTLARPVRRRVSPWFAVAGAAGIAAVLWAVSVQPWAPRGVASDVDSLRARDAGPGGAAPTMEIAPGTSTGATGSTPRGLRGAAGQTGAADTVPVFRDVSDGAHATSVPIVITRAESLAIAEAVRKRQAENRAPQPAQAARTAAPLSAVAARTESPVPNAGMTTAMGAGATGQAARSMTFVRTADGLTQIDRNVLLAEVGRIFADSMLRALTQMDSVMARVPRALRVAPLRPREPAQPTLVTPLMAPPEDARLRVVITPYTNSTGRRDGAATARALTGEVRSALAADRFDVVPAPMVDKAMQSLPDQMAVGWALRADYVVGGTLTMRADSAVLVTILTDVRTGRFTKASQITVSLSDPVSTYDMARRQVVAWLDTASTIAARRGGRNAARPDPSDQSGD